MNRPIKFRVWDKEERHMHYMPAAELYENFFLRADGVLCDVDIGAGYADPRPVYDRYEFSFSTGLCDCHGREIWEGDVLQHKIEPDFRLLVEYRRGAYRIIDSGPTSHNGCEEGLLDEVDGECFMYQIIGNKYENPELLERKE